MLAQEWTVRMQTKKNSASAGENNLEKDYALVTGDSSHVWRKKEAKEHRPHSVTPWGEYYALVPTAQLVKVKGIVKSQIKPRLEFH